MTQKYQLSWKMFADPKRSDSAKNFNPKILDGAPSIKELSASLGSQVRETDQIIDIIDCNWV